MVDNIPKGVFINTLVGRVGKNEGGAKKFGPINKGGSKKFGLYKRGGHTSFGPVNVEPERRIWLF